jgi:hypothetical protein
MQITFLVPRFKASLARWRLSGAVVAVAVVLAACGGGGSGDGAQAPAGAVPSAISTPATQSAQVRTVNALDDPAVATLSAGSQALNASDVDSPVSDFASVADNAAISLAVVAEGSSATTEQAKVASQGSSSAISVPMNTGRGDKVTVFAMGESGNVRTVHIKQSTTDVAADKTGVRVLHAAPRVPTVDIYVSAPGAALPGTPTIAALAFANFAPPPDQASLKVPKGSYQVRLTAAGSKDVVFDSGTVTFPGGQELLIAALPSFTAGAAVNLLLLPSDSKPTLIREPRSALRAVHLSPDAPAVDVLLGDKRVVRQLMFRQDSAFVESLAGTRTVKITPADNTGTAVITATVNLPADKVISVVALNKLTNIEPALIVDDGKPATPGNSKLRVLHASAGVPAVDVYLTPPTDALPTDAAIKALSFKNAAPASGEAALSVPAGDYRVRLTLAGKRDVVYDSGAFKIRSREDLVVAAIPPKVDVPAQPSPVDLLVIRTRGASSLIKSQTSTMPSPTTNTMTVTTSLRALHASPQAPAVDLLVDGTQTIGSLTFGNFSERVGVAEGTRVVKVNVAGTSTTVLSATLTVAKDTAYSVVAYDTPASLKALVLKDEVKTAFSGARGYIRIVNVISDVQGTATFTGSSTGGGGFGTAAPYGENSPGSKTVSVSYTTATGQGQAAVGFNLEQGNYYTVYAVGSATGAGGKPVRLIVSRDSKAP